MRRKTEASASNCKVPLAQMIMKNYLSHCESILFITMYQKRITMQSAEGWRSILENWPEAIPKKGIVVTNYQESIPFQNFLLSTAVVLLERDKPDSLGARKVMLSYDAICAIKLTDTMELARYQVMGFQPSISHLSREITNRAAAFKSSAASP